MKSTTHQGWQDRPHAMGVAAWAKRIKHFFIVPIVWLSLMLLNTGAVALGHTALPPSAMFSAYTEQLPGNPRSALKANDSPCHWQFEPFSRTEYCRFTMSSGAFSHVDAFVDETEIRQLDFAIRDDALRIGDLLLLWGKPTTILRFRGSLHFIWQRGTGAKTPSAAYPSPLLRVLKVYMVDTDIPTLIKKMEAD